jgi:hypothetical protein
VPLARCSNGQYASYPTDAAFHNQQSHEATLQHLAQPFRSAFGRRETCLTPAAIFFRFSAIAELQFSVCGDTITWGRRDSCKAASNGPSGRDWEGD